MRQDQRGPGSFGTCSVDQTALACLCAPLHLCIFRGASFLTHPVIFLFSFSRCVPVWQLQPCLDHMGLLMSFRGGSTLQKGRRKQTEPTETLWSTSGCNTLRTDPATLNWHIAVAQARDHKNASYFLNCKSQNGCPFIMLRNYILDK